MSSEHQTKLELPENMKGVPPAPQDEFPPIGMGPAVWGPIFWRTMHLVTIGYPAFPSKDEQIAAVAFFDSLQFMIPCPICKEHYKDNLKNFPVTDAVENKQKLIRWLFDLHNTINTQLGKPAISWREFVYSIAELAVLPKFSFTDAINAQRPSMMPNTQSLLFLVAGIGLGAAGYYAYKHFLNGKY